MHDPTSLTSKQETKRALMQRLAVATATAREATDRYVEIQRECDVTVDEASRLLAASRELREQLRSVVSSYVSLLRREGAPPERVIVLVKEAVEMSELALDVGGRRALMEEVVTWVVDAYYAA